MSSSLLLVDKYRPRTLDELSYHHELSERIRTLVGGDFPHVLIYGPNGAGKKTRVMATLRELFGKGVESLRIDQRVFVTPGGRKLEVNVVQSNFHVELTPSDVGQWDRTVVQEIIKDIAQTQQVDMGAKHKFKVAIINEADQLTRDAQAALRRTMEKYARNLRLILCANTTSGIIEPIKSRCLILRVASPTPEEGTNVLMKVASEADMSLPHEAAQRIYKASGGNIRRALLSLEAAWMVDPSFAKVITEEYIPEPDWVLYIRHVREALLKEQTPQQLLTIRGMLYELLVHCIPASTIMTTLTEELVQHVSKVSLKMNIIKEAAAYEHRVHLGSKVIFHLEAYCAKVMSLYKKDKLGM